MTLNMWETFLQVYYDPLELMKSVAFLEPVEVETYKTYVAPVKLMYIKMRRLIFFWVILRANSVDQELRCVLH